MHDTGHSRRNPIAGLALPPDEHAVLAMRAQLLASLRTLVSNEGWTQAETMRRLGISRAMAANLRSGKWEKFDLDLLVTLATRAGRKPSLELIRD